jgi:hypothetical protein
MSDAPSAEPKTPARPRAEILADIERERSALAGSFGALRDDLDLALEAGEQRAREAGRKAAAIAPIVAGVVVTAAAATLMYRRRRSGGDA